MRIFFQRLDINQYISPHSTSHITSKDRFIFLCTRRLSEIKYY